LSTGSAVFFAHSTVVYNYEKAYLPHWFTRSWPWWALKVFITKQGLDFLAMAFLLLTWRECVAAWASVHYLPLLYMVVVLVLGNLFPVRAKKVRKGDAAAGAAAPAGGSSREEEAAAKAEPVSGDHLHLGEGYKSALVPSRPGSRPDLTNGVKQE
jgi:lysophospholipid acyltransferase